MTKFFNILNRKLTIGNIFTIIGSFIFAIIVRHWYQYFFEFLPIKGELEALDISYFGIVVLFRFIFSAFLEYLLNDKFNIPLNEAIGGLEQKGLTTSAMVNSDPQGSSAESSSKGKRPLTDEDRKFLREKGKGVLTKENKKFLDDEFDLGEKMDNVLMEQEKKIMKLWELKATKNVKFFEENGSLDLTVPANMTDIDAKNLSKEVGALDRSIQNKFSEYRNLSSRDVRLHNST